MNDSSESEITTLDGEGVRLLKKLRSGISIYASNDGWAWGCNQYILDQHNKILCKIEIDIDMSQGCGFISQINILEE